MNKIKVTYKYMRHSGGTKFYETVMLDCPETRKAMTIFRWGKVELSLYGGETQQKKFDSSTYGKHEQHFYQKVNEKKKPKNGGVYEDFGLGRGLATAIGNNTTKVFTDLTEIQEVLNSHPGNTHLMSALDYVLDGNTMPSSGVSSSVAGKQVTTDYNFDRGEEWGSF